MKKNKDHPLAFPTNNSFTLEQASVIVKTKSIIIKANCV